MKNKLTNDLSLLEEMIKDQNSKYKVDPFWKNYEYSNVTKIKHFDLKKLLQFSNSFGATSSKRYTILGTYFIRLYFGILIKIKKYLKIDLAFPKIFKTLNFFNYTIDDHKLTRAIYSQFIFKLIDSFPNSDKLLNIKDDLVWNPIDTFELMDKKYSFNFIRYFYEFLMANNFANFEKSNFFLEIGGGYGGFTEIVKKMCPNIKIIYMDIPPQLYVAEQYLKSIFYKKVAGFKETKEMEFITQDSFLDYDILIVPPWDIKKIQNDLIDNFYNANSFQEMQKNTVSNYCKQLGRIVKRKIVLHEQREGNGAIVDPVTRIDYIDYMKLNGFNLVEEKLGSYGGHLRSDPSAPFSHTDLYFFEKAN